MRRTLAVAAVSGGFYLGIALGAFAAPPENSDGRYAEWFRSLAQPGTGVSCCDLSDCRPTDYRTSDTGYQVLINDNWINVPNEKVLQGKENPIGRAVVCWTPSRGVMCFVRATEI